MIFWMALWAPLFFQDPSGDLRREIEQLKKQNLELQERLSLLEKCAVEDAQTIQRLREVVKLLEFNSAPPDAPAAPKSPVSPAVKPEIGPTRPIKAKLVFVDVKQNFVALSRGKQDGVQVGYKFQILRETYENGGESKLTSLGMGEVEKFLGGEESMTKLVIKEGNIADMKVDDLAIAIRKLGDVPKDKSEGRTDTKPEPPESPKDGVYKITGILGDGFVINYGSLLGAQQTQLLYAYRDGKFKAKLRLDKVEKSHSIGYVVDGSMQIPPEQDDQVFTRELRKGLAGKVALADVKRGFLAVDLRGRDGIKIGTHCEVRRLGQKIGVIVITDVQAWGSWAKPEGDLNIDQVQKGDFVEVVEEK